MECVEIERGASDERNSVGEESQEFLFAENLRFSPYPFAQLEETAINHHRSVSVRLRGEITHTCSAINNNDIVYMYNARLYNIGNKIIY